MKYLVLLIGDGEMPNWNELDEQQQAEGASANAGADEPTAEAAPAEEDVVDAEFSEVDDDKKA